MRKQGLLAALFCLLYHFEPGLKRPLIFGIKGPACHKFCTVRSQESIEYHRFVQCFAQRLVINIFGVMHRHLCWQSLLRLLGSPRSSVAFLDLE